MTSLQVRLGDRSRELQTYLEFVSAIEDDPQLVRGSSKGPVSTRIDADIPKILKANALLLLYNMVEATIREGFEFLYAAVSGEQCTVRELKREFQLVWVDDALKKVDVQSANSNSYRTVTRKLVLETLDDVVAQLAVENLRFSGNIDAQVIRRTCRAHGVPHQTRKSAKGGEKLVIVKEKRNALAHGSLSFSECGRDFSLAQLAEIQRESVLFLRGILQNIERHVRRKSYRR